VLEEIIMATKLKPDLKKQNIGWHVALIMVCTYEHYSIMLL
jgi:hypothetical protein